MPDPDRGEIAKIDQAIANERRRVEALEIALDQAFGELVDAAEGARGDLTPEIAQLIAAARADERAAIDALRAARSRRGDFQGLRRWLDHFPDTLRYQPGVSPYLAGVKGQSGDPIAVETVLAALEAE